jgi:hypothetical protein
LSAGVANAALEVLRMAKKSKDSNLFCSRLTYTSHKQDVSTIVFLYNKHEWVVVLTGVESIFSEVPKVAAATPVQEEKNRRFLGMFSKASESNHFFHFSFWKRCFNPC